MSDSLKSIIFSLALMLGLCLPEGNLSLLFQSVLPIFLYLSITDLKEFKVNRFLLVFLSVMFISLIINLFFFESFTFKAILRSLNFLVLFLIFPFSSRIRISIPILYFIVGFILTSQLAYSIGISPLVSFFDSFYPYLGEKKGYSSEFLASGAGDMSFIVNRRYGGIFHNPNQCVRYISALFIAFNIETFTKGLNVKLPFIGMVYLSVILSGSRTGLLVITLLLLYTILIYKKKALNLKTILVLCLTFLLGIIAYLNMSELGLRIFDITEGAETSFTAKFNFFGDFIWQLQDGIRFLFGHFTSENIDKIYRVSQLDSEWGELFYNYGILGTIALFLFYQNLWSTKNSEVRFFMLILLWGVTSTILFSFRMSFVFMLLLSNYYSGYLINNRSKRAKSANII